MVGNRRLLLIAGNYWPEPTGIGKYNGEMIDWLSVSGYDCTVITTYPYYPFWKVQEPYRKGSYKFTREEKHRGSLPTKVITAGNKNIKIIRCPHYIPKNPSGLKRMLSDLSFFICCSIAMIPLFLSGRFNVVMSVAPPFQSGLLALLYGKIKGAKTIYHIQDLQIDAAKELGMVRNQYLLQLLFSIEKFILKHTDVVSTISSGMQKRIAARYRKPIVFFPNWTDTSTFFPLANREDLKEQFGFKALDHIVLYSGAMGEKQGLESILKVAEQLKDVPSLQFVICGSGPYQVILQNMQRQMQLDNVIFMPLQPKEQFNEFLNMADVHLVLQKANASDLVMPSKLTGILSVGGVSIVTASAGTSLYELVQNNHIGLIVEPENQQALAEAIRYAVTSDLDEIRLNARHYAEKNLSIDMILKRFSAEVLGAKESQPFTVVQ